MQGENEEFEVGGISLQELSEEYGTPLYVYDGAKIRSQYQRLAGAFKGLDVKIKYACKANSNINILKLLKQEGSGLDAVSINEVRLGMKAGYEPQEILYTPNGVSMEEMEEAVDLGVNINIDNISILEQFGHKYQGSVPVCIRINPHVMAGGNAHIQTGHIDSKFGISIHQIRHVIRVVKANNMDIAGLHMHTGSDIVDAEVFTHASELLFEAALNFDNLRYVDLGSGFKVGYRKDDVTTDIERLGKVLGKRFNEFCETYGKKLELWFEPGKFLVSEAGIFLVKVNVVKQTVSTVFAGVDSGQNHLIRPMMYEAYHHIVNISNRGETQRVYSVVGYICETDTFGYDRKLTEVRTGDVLAIYNAGAYGFTMASNYNFRVRPAEVLVLDGKAHLIRRRENFDDLMQNQIEVL
ncbi:MAG TPA: diaminopimelate decarboxylase [Cryomorphaceae bacterium]|nr:diaminopimelate decarboxylase [Cryomorphaceae bacterium]HKL40699.1 diaminopimelate decarboxylase [Cryomorphaceae bacterium]